MTKEQHSKLIQGLQDYLNPYTNWDGSPSDVMESERVVALIDNMEVCIATLNQNIDEDTNPPAGEPYWFDEGETEDGGWIAERVTHWMPMPALPEKGGEEC